jgi:hypothetical protein
MGKDRKESMLGKTVPQPKGNFLMELTDLPFHGSGFPLFPLQSIGITPLP